MNPDGVLVNPKEGEKRLGPPRQQVFDALAELDVEARLMHTLNLYDAHAHRWSHSELCMSPRLRHNLIPRSLWHPRRQQHIQV